MQNERRIYLINKLLEEDKKYSSIEIPKNVQEQEDLLRSLFNVRPPKPIDAEFLKVQDEYLAEEINKLGIVTLDEIDEIEKEIYLWQGDITRLKVGAIVNAANNKLLGCFVPLHKCIDNAIHTFSGIQLRLECNEIMQKQGHDEETGAAKITSAYNLPCDYIIHTVGPIIYKELTQEDCELLKSCYLESLKLAEEKQVESIAFCCISTGVFHFPNEKAAEIAVDTVKRYKRENNSKIKVVFNVFKNEDLKIYNRILR